MKTLYTITNLIKNIALMHPNVRTASEGNIYDTLNDNPGVEYDVVFLTQGTHRETEDTYVFNFNIMFVTRLEDDLEENRLQGQSIGIRVISNILKTLEDRYDVEIGDHTFQTWTQQFVDETCGVLCNVELTVYKEWDCSDEFGTSFPAINITENGKYDIGGFDVHVLVESGDYQEGFEDGERAQKEKLTTLNVTSNNTYTREDGYDRVIVNVPTGATVNNQTKSLTITSNGSSTITYDSAYTGLERVNWEVNVPTSGGSDVNKELITRTLSAVTSDMLSDGIGQYAFAGCQITTINIPSHITEIPAGAFKSSRLQTISLPSTLTKISDEAFSISDLRSIDIPETVTVIDSHAFDACYNLQSLVFPEAVTLIANNVCLGCYALESVEMGANVTGIDGYAFGSCRSLMDITCHAVTAPAILISLNNPFFGLPENGTLHVPAGSDYSTWLAKLPAGWTIDYI